ncbi:hypothetical protein JCM19037_1611 [Geomicrobium sp. JCM 19037]|uniref:hypothetical protein n=1 Tax=Geomicrobium sp. JCM 19037 TaxID=1460634 RepID=UPI00045F4D89|nr:hypothetical protein [Geomicrobium sp. JCM 19037]GAK03297.1 hypothetical protein JCM19037_1611 [Geomicrobium sp. JCM 19037]
MSERVEWIIITFMDGTDERFNNVTVEAKEQGLLTVYFDGGIATHFNIRNIQSFRVKGER